MPAYRNLHPDMVPQPFFLKGANITSFVMETAPANLQAICDRWLNGFNSQWEFKPLLPFSLIMFADYAGTYPTTPPYCNEGIVPYKEVITSFYVGRYDVSGPTPVLIDIYNMADYCWVDTSITMLGGQLIYGMTKTLGEITIPTDASGEFSISAYSLKNFGPQEIAANNMIIQVNPGLKPNPPANPAPGLLSTLESVLAIFAEQGFSNDLKEIELVVKALFTGEIPMISMRQLRGIANPEEQSFAELITFTSKVEKINAHQLLGNNFTINMQNVDSLPVMQDYGWMETNQPILVFRVNMDFIFTNGTTLFSTLQLTNQPNS